MNSSCKNFQDGSTGGAGGQRMVEQVEQEGRGWWSRWSRRAEDGSTGGPGGQRMVVQVKQRAEDAWWHRWSRRAAL